MLVRALKEPEQKPNNPICYELTLQPYLAQNLWVSPYYTSLPLYYFFYTYAMHCIITTGTGQAEYSSKYYSQLCICSSFPPLALKICYNTKV